MEMTHDRDHPSLLRAARIPALFSGGARAARFTGQRGARWPSFSLLLQSGLLDCAVGGGVARRQRLIDAHLSGERAGLWFDHATGEGGDLIELWRIANPTVNFVVVVEDLECWCGWAKKPRFASTVAKVAKTRQEAARAAPRAAQALGKPVATWTYRNAAGASLAIVKRYDLAGQFDETGKQKKTFRPFLPNGAAGMPNFDGNRCGLITRIATSPCPHAPLYGVARDGVHIDALAVDYDTNAFLARFLKCWPPGTPAYESYYRRIVDGPDYAVAQAAP